MLSFNEKILNDLRQTAAEQRVANAYLLSGSTAEERRLIAETFAGLLIDSPADLVRPEQEKPQLFSVDDVRAGISDTVHIRPYGQGKKVYLIENAALMNTAAQNALLKTLEEPPEYVVILLLAPNNDVFLPTILSRAVKLSLAGEPDGSNEEQAREIREDVFRMLERREELGIEEILKTVKKYEKARPLAKTATEAVRSWFRDVLVSAAGGEDALLENKEYRTSIRETAKRVSPEQIGSILEASEEARKRTEANGSFELNYAALFSGIARTMAKGR